MDRTFLPFARPSIGQDEIDTVVETLKSGWLTTGPKTRQFEQDFAAYIGARHCVAVNSATAGLHLALEAIGVGPGDKVITTTFTFTATAEVIRYLGADPVLVDCDDRTLLIDIDALKRALVEHPSVKAVMPVHFAGRACNMDEILAIARAHGVKVIEDAAHALPSKWNGKLVGTAGDVTVFSFYANKTITTGEGGMAVTADAALADRMRTMRLHGINRDVFDRFTSRTANWYYEVVAPGFKYNIPDIASAIGIVQLKKANVFQQQRAHIAGRYTEAFADLPVILPADIEPGALHAWHLYVLRLDPEKVHMTRNAFIEALTALGIGTSVHYIPLHLHPYWRDTYRLDPADFPAANRVYDSCVSLPIWQGMTEADIDRVIAAVRRVLLDNVKIV
jgi:dTDP-4-amino-4,6-dideoxygalactose transaminase